MKNQALWLQARDENTKYLDNFTKLRKLHNTFSNIEQEDGSILSRHKGLASS